MLRAKARSFAKHHRARSRPVASKQGDSNDHIGEAVAIHVRGAGDRKTGEIPLAHAVEAEAIRAIKAGEIDRREFPPPSRPLASRPSSQKFPRSIEADAGGAVPFSAQLAYDLKNAHPCGSGNSRGSLLPLSIQRSGRDTVGLLKSTQILPVRG
jgi:hypothetical protein